ncbi:E3 ubiquitin-protein ligase TRIM39-like [Engystomops pustulosus]|uniref:E3 ubiquitin-protein ligase TRIM39-like n=1 Tax=Engystomops pustulosus TaxID=76066 RepID=UPI003AFAABB3
MCCSSKWIKTTGFTNVHFYLFLLLSVMASAGQEEKLKLSVCLNLHKDPVTLRYGHNSCQVCIDLVLNTENGSGVSPCLESREELEERPALQRNITLRHIVENFLSALPQEVEVIGNRTTYYLQSPVPAVRSHLRRQSSLCDNHLRVYTKGPKHILTDPSTSLENQKCSVHKKNLEYYCMEDAACICVSCCLTGEHRDHQVETLGDASEMKKEKLSKVLRKLYTKRQKADDQVQRLEERRGRAQEKSDKEAERVNALFTDIRRQLDELENKMHCEISRQEEQVSLSLSELIQKLEKEKEELSSKIRNIEDRCKMTDPLTVLKDSDTVDLSNYEEDVGDEDTSDLFDPEKEGDDEDILGDNRGDHGAQMISNTFYTLSEIIRSVNVTFYGQRPADILLDINTSANNILISGDLKTATRTEKKENRPETAERFQYFQVMSRTSFLSGRHYWDVEISYQVEQQLGGATVKEEINPV